MRLGNSTGIGNLRKKQARKRRRQLRHHVL